MESATRFAEQESILPILRKRLPEKTVLHSLSVAEFMLQLAPLAGVEYRQALLAGLLHDSRKATPNDRLLALAEEYGIAITELQRSQPKMLHGPVAAEESVRRFGADAEVYEAIYWHTTGRPGLCRTGIALYLADFAEPRRERDFAARAREILLRDGFMPAVCYAAKSKLEYVRTKSKVDPSTEAFYEWLVKERG